MLLSTRLRACGRATVLPDLSLRLMSGPRKRSAEQIAPALALSNLLAAPRLAKDDVNKVIRTFWQNFNLSQIVKLLHACSRERSGLITKKNVLRIKDQIEKLGPAAKLSGAQIGKVMYSMRQFTCQNYAARLLLSALCVKIGENKEKLSSHTLASMVYGINNMESKHPEIRQYLIILTTKMLRSRDTFKYFEVSSALYGLRYMDSEYKEVQEVLSVLARKIESSRDTFNSQTISNCLYGMQSMSSKHEPVRYLLSVIRYKIEHCNISSGESMNAQAVGNALYGLQGMSSDRLEVRRLLTALRPKIEACEQLFTAQAVGNSLYGLRSMNSDHEEVRSLLSVLAPKIRNCIQFLSVQNIDNSFFGLQRMSSDHEEVRAILSALLTKLGSRKLDSHAFGSVLFGLQRMDCQHREVCEALTAVSAALPEAECDPVLPSTATLQENNFFHATGYAMAFSGLRLMKDDTIEVNNLLKKILDLMIRCPEDFRNSSIVNILYGLQSMTGGRDGTVRKILHFASSQLHKNNTASGANEVVGKNEALTAQHVGRALYGMKCMSSDLPEVRDVLQNLAASLEQNDMPIVFSTLDLKRVVYGLRGMCSEHQEVRRFLAEMTCKLQLPDSLCRTEGEGGELLDEIVQIFQDDCVNLKISDSEVAAFSKCLLSLHLAAKKASSTENVSDMVGLSQI